LWIRPLIVGVGVFLVLSLGLHLWLAGSAVLGILAFLISAGVLHRRARHSVRTS
jgi:hypothetical protein